MTGPGAPVRTPRPPVPPAEGIRRPRLERALDRIDDVRSGIVVAPQGSGKTTLMAQWAGAWAERTGHRVVWTRCERDDGHHRLVVRPPRPALGLAEGVPATLGDLRRSVDAFGEPTLVVVDDAHEIHGEPAERDLERLVAHRPAHVRLLVASRRPTLLDTARSELATAVALTPQSLRFRAWEVRSLYRDHYRTPLAAEDVAALTWHTEGWAAALHLFHRSVADDFPGERRRAVRRLDHRYRFAWDYVASQVLAGLPVEHQRFLHRTAAFETLTAELCADAAGEVDARTTLRSIADATTLLETHDGVGYRLHPVVRRHLATAATDEMTSTEARAWHRAAADALERAGSLGEALRARCRAADLDGVRRLLTRVSPGAADSPSRDWVSLIPETLLAHDPVAQLTRSRELAFDGRFPEADAWRRRAAEELDAADPADDETAVAQDLYTGLYRAMRPWLGEHDAPGTAEGPAVADGHAAWPLLALRAARGNPVAAARDARALPARRALGEGIARLVAGDLPSAGALLTEAAEDVDADPAAMMIAQLVGALLVDRDDAAATVVMLDHLHVEAVRRRLHWLARLAHGLLAAHDETSGEVDEIVAYCDRLGDRWGAAFIAGTRAARLGPRATAAHWAGLAARFAELGAAALEAWSRARHALALALAGSPDALDAARAAEATAERAQVPGALAAARSARAAAVTATRGPASSTPADDPLRIEVRCFGQFSIRVRDRLVDLARLRPQARRALHLLALHAGRPVHRDALVAALWGDVEPGRAVHNLHVTLSAVRRVLEPDSARGKERLVVRDAASYALALPGGSTCDTVELERRVAAARRRADVLAARGPGPERDPDTLATARAWQDALDLYTGELLPEAGSAEWVLPSRDRYRLTAADAAVGLATANLRLGRAPSAVVAAQRGIELNRWSDVAWRVLVEALRSAGDLGAALRAEREYHAVLLELGVEPGVETGPLTGRGTRPRRQPRGSWAPPGTSRRP